MATDQVQTDANQWHDKQRRFMEWLALSSFDRDPLTQQGLAELLRVNESTLCRWKLLPGFMDEVRRLITASLGDVYHDVMHSFKQEATKGSYQHQRTYFEMLGVYTPRQEITGKDGEPLGVALVEVVRDKKGQGENE